mmetsp:Transcript_2321/g.3016  ORF Transcript_2321/g.3016 Transcript_2321/m.3016 type:complete len:226 (-) Transcript_2321:52-729(-)|eukprot:CAMPEP_0172508082 /NCGR_PEP_ID=MMETSP1066-20121228/209058_1 /TAXON_ID=671091 /ORGANISM="Coscinodiscus wailesii, Strain CCMP2513" /LENGTH=225 /DNA_ID=CAMNT_0013285901 /DNA_START=170 /DNA_END=850 /DNA_ORIENTATION=+
MTESFWKAAQSLISVTEKHPFLTSMVDGTLPEANFRYYVVQDALYLTDFAACLRLLSRHPAAASSAATRLSQLADGAEHDETELHKSFFTKWDIDAAGAKQMPRTLLYTSYMLRVVATRCYEEGLAVLLPCFWVYMHVGKCMLKLREELGDSVKRVPQYDAWIDMYAGDEFEKEVRDYIAIVDEVMMTASEDTKKKMEEHFLMSCKLEHMFWDQAQDLLDWPVIE